MKELRELFSTHEDWLTKRILKYAKARNYTKYTATLEDAWRVSIAGISESLSAALDKQNAPAELDPGEDCQFDPVAAFGIKEARRHRQRGVNLGMFLGLMKYYRQAYVDLVLDSYEASQAAGKRLFVDRFFDRLEIGFCQEWSSLDQTTKFAELQTANRNMTNEKNKYLTLFESMRDPAALLDSRHRIETVNHSASVLFPDFPAAGAVYYRESSEPQAWPWFQDELAILAAGATPERTFEAQLETVHGLCVFQVKMKRMLDVSEKFSGTVVILSDITARKRYEERLNHLARHDPLTGLLNRHALLEILDQESKRSKRYRRPIGVLMADVNRFKEINDEFGHPVGDEVLKSLATIFMQQVRESDIAIRYGGDEFLVLLLETGRQVELVRSRIVKAVERWSNTQTLTDFPVTLSIGAAYWDVGSQASLDEALAIADRQMYAAKQDSRAAMTG